MSEGLGVSSDVKQWLIDLINKLGKAARDFETAYDMIPSELLVSFIRKCNGIWDYDIIK